MGDQKKEEDEKKVPVFTVFKKNSILKNIFLDAPQTNEPLNSTTNQEDDEQVIVIGRHPDCSITLDHPSISRFHLRLHSKPSSLSLSLVDLSSVHGTWVSGKKVEPGVQVDLNEGDIVQLGGSSRRYMLHWVPMSRAYDSDVPFVPPMDVLMTVKEGEELSNQDENCCSSFKTNQIQSQCKTVGDLDSSISKKEMTVSPLDPTMPEFGDSSRDNEKAKKGNLSSEKKRKQNEISGISSGQPLKEELIEEIKNQHSDKDSENSPNASSPSKDPDDKDLIREEHEENEISGFSSETPLKEGELIEEIKNQHSDKGWENSPNASSPSNDHNKDLFREEHEENEISGISSGTPLKESAITKFKNQQSDKENDENPQALAGLLTGISYAKSPSGDHNKNLLREEYEENEISAFSSGQLLSESIVEIEYQQYDEEYENSQDLNEVLSGIADANSTTTIDHYEHPLREEFEENEIHAFSSGQLLNESVEEIKHLQYDGEYEENEISASGDHNKNLLREEYEENEISAFSSGQLLSESIVEIEYQQYDEEYENSQDLNEVLSGIADANSTTTIDHYEHPLREEFEENEIHAFSSGQLLNESVEEIKHLQYDGEYEKFLSGIANVNSSPAMDHYREEFEEHAISAFSSGQLLNESVLEVECQQYDEALDGVLSGVADANSSSTIYHNEHPLKEEFKKDVNSSPAMDHYREEFEEHAISAFSSGQLLNESVLEVECQQYDEALDGVLSGVADANSSSAIYHNEHPLKEEFKKDEISAFTSLQILSTIYHNEHPLKEEFKKDVNSSPAMDHYREEFEEHAISAFSSGQLLNESVLEVECQQYDEALDGVLSGVADANSSSTIYHNEHPLKEEFKKDEISAFTSLQILSESVVEIGNQQYDEDEKDEISAFISVQILNESVVEIGNQQYDEEHAISAFSSGQLLNESVLEVECQQYDEALDGVLSGIADANSSSTIYLNEHPLKEEFKKDEISAFTSLQILSESVVEIGNQQYDEDEKDEISAFISVQILNESVVEIGNQQYDEEHAISAFSSGHLLNESVLEVECQQYDEALDGVLSGIADANSSSTINHNEHLLKEEFKKDERAFTSLQILSESVVEIGNQQSDEDEKDEISAFISVQILNESVVEIGNQQYDEDNVKSQAVDGVPSSVANSHGLCQNYHNNNLSEFFSSSFSNEDVEVICASRIDNEQENMSTSSCYSTCSTTILERKDQLYLYEQDLNVQDSSSSGVHAIQLLRKTPRKSEQESHWPEIMGHSIANVGKSSEALDHESSLKEDNKQKEITVITRAPKMDLMNLSICCESIPAEDCFGQLDEKNKKGQTFAINVSEPKDTDVNTPLRSGKQSDPPPTIRGKPTSIDIQTGIWFPTDTEAKELYVENVDYGSVSKALVSNGEVFAEEIFTPDKENFNSTTPKQKSTKKTDKLEEIKFSDPLCLSSPTKNSICSNFVQSDELLFSSDKENHTPKVLQKSRLVQPASKNSARLNLQPATKNGISRIPFKSLLSNSSSKSCSSNSGKYVKPIEKKAVAGDNKRWIMVADTNSLLNKVSRKALQLLQGVKGTQLIIPRVVIRELDCMKRRGYLFTRTTEISSALQWIEDCMMNTNWWIHVESLMEEERHFTPSPSLSTSEGENEDFAFSSTLFSAFPKFLEIVSLMPGDHILECALLNRRMKNDENLVILSDDVSLKIKAMAEGIICEAAEEFRESLVNPFSDRFLWAKSTPRGLTWSCADDTVLREKYYRGPFKKPPSKSGESLKGLKLVLVQNSHFGGLIPNSLEMNCF